MGYFNPDPGSQKYLAPWEDSPGKGSRDSVMQDAMGWGTENLSKYLLDNGGDPLGVLDPQAVGRFLGPINARKEERAMRELPFFNGWNWGVETEPNQVFTEFTPAQVKAYTDRTRADYVAAGNGGNDAMWLPQYIEQGGKSFVAWGKPNDGSGGFLDKFTPIAENWMALSGFAGAAIMANAAATAAIAAETAVGGGSLAGTAGLEAGLGATNAWSLSGAIDTALDPTRLLTSGVKNVVGQLVSTGDVSPEGLIAGVIGNAVGGVAGGAVGDATGSGLIGSVTGSVVGGLTGSAINDALTDDPTPPSGSSGGSGTGSTTGTGSTGSTGSTPVVNDVPMGFDMALSPYQPIYQRA